MKKFFYSIILGSLLLLASGCNNLENASIYTTTYPIEYLATTLYSDHSTSSSIYPDGAIVDDYTLTEKQIGRLFPGVKIALCVLLHQLPLFSCIVTYGNFQHGIISWLHIWSCFCRI